MLITELLALLQKFNNQYKPHLLATKPWLRRNDPAPEMTGNKSSVKENDYLFYQARHRFAVSRHDLAIAREFLKIVSLPCYGEKALERLPQSEQQTVKDAHYIRSDALIFSPELIAALRDYVNALATFSESFAESEIHEHMQAYCRKLANDLHERNHSSANVERAVNAAKYMLKGTGQKTLTVACFFEMEQASFLFRVKDKAKPSLTVSSQNWSTMFMAQEDIAGAVLERELKAYFIKHFTPNMLNIFSRMYRHTSLYFEPAVTLAKLESAAPSVGVNQTNKRALDEGITPIAKKR